MTYTQLSHGGTSRVSGIRRFWIAGLPVDTVGRDEILGLFEHAVTRQAPFVLANLNLHGLYCALTTAPMAALLQSENTIVHIDGTPILWAARLAGVDIPPVARNTHIDLIPQLLELCAARGWLVVIVNSDTAGASQNQRALETLVSDLRIVALSGSFDDNDMGEDSTQKKTIEQIRMLRPALLLVGLGMPKQEAWIAQVRDLLEIPMIMPVGGFADYFTGRAKTPPRFLGPLGLEGAYRLIHAPRRLGFRYLIEPILLLGLLVKAFITGTKWGRQRGGDGMWE